MIDTVKDREIASKATDGPWYSWNSGDSAAIYVGRNADGKIEVGSGGFQMLAMTYGASCTSNKKNFPVDERNATLEYIAHFNPQYIKELLDAVNERDALSLMVSELEKMVDTRDEALNTVYESGMVTDSDMEEVIRVVLGLSQSNQEQEV
jgi:hypothetical protein